MTQGPPVAGDAFSIETILAELPGIVELLYRERLSKTAAVVQLLGSEVTRLETERRRLVEENACLVKDLVEALEKQN